MTAARRKLAAGDRMPLRIQRKRTKGWRLPENTVYVGRPSIWGNPFRDAKTFHIALLEPITMIQAMAFVSAWNPRLSKDAISSLRGKNLACWCPLNQPCHADVLLEIANA